MDTSSPTVRHFSATYDVLEKIGEGGFGQVFKSINRTTGQTVAIKELILNPGFDADKRRRYIERFEREIMLCSRLTHPNIVRLLDKGQSSEHHLYAVFEYVEGQTLRDWLLENGPLNPVMAADVMLQVLDALVHAHHYGVIHRDIKPANIMLSSAGARTHVKILDFGIGALTNETRAQSYKSITLTQETLGTPSYSAPEQLRGEPPTPKSDLYVWGLVFIECLTGVPAVSGSSLASVFQKQLNPNNIPLPVALAGHPVAAVLRRVLNKRLDERAGDALEIYQLFSQMNFSNLVGTIVDAQSSVVSGENTFDGTLIDDASMLNSAINERKQITVMCVRLSMQMLEGDTSTDEEMEIIQALYQDQQAQCVDIVLRYGALHVGSLGDTMLFYFGYPHATENDSRLCARAALELLSQLNKRNSLLKVTQRAASQAQIGVHTGMVTIQGDAIPEGDTPNIAMALAHAAAANQILCTDNTRKVLESHIEFDAHDAMALGMRQQALPLAVMTGERLVEAFGFLRANQRHESFVGRDQELTALTELKANNAECRFAYVHGEAGIGKSRLVQEFRNASEHYHHFVIQCLPEYKNKALHPVLTLVSRKFSLDTLPDEEAVSLLQQLLAEQDEIDGQLALAILCAWLNLTMPEATDVPMVSPEESKVILFAALIHLLVAAQDSEVAIDGLFIFEDIHWSDPTTIEFIHVFLASSQFQDAQHIVVGTSRQPLPEALQAESVLQVAVSNLQEQYMAEFITQLFDHKSVADEVIKLLVERTDGIPLFIEELVNMLKQKKLVHYLNGQISFVSTDSIDEVPHSLRDSLQQKLDSLMAAKDTAQLASAIGREFDYELLQQATTQDDGKMQADLEDLLRAELIFVQRKVSGDSYIFKHALVRDAAYDSMTPQRRKDSHRTIASSLESRGEKYCTENAALLSLHWGEAEVFDRAIDCGDQAANAALKRSSANEAITQALKIQDWVKHLDSEAQTETLLKNYGLLTSAYMETKGWGSAEVLQYSQASLDLLKSSHRYDQLVSHLWWQMLNGIVGGRRQQLSQLSQELEALVGEVSAINRSAIQCVQGFYHFTDGNRDTAISYLTDAIACYDEEADKAHQQTFGFDVRIFAKVTLARAYADQNNDAQAVALANEGLAEAKAYNHVPSIGISLMYCGLVQQQYQNKDVVKQCASELIEISEQYNLPIYLGFGQMMHDWAVGSTERADEILAMLKNAGSMHGLGHFQSFYAETYAQNGDYEKAIAKIDECIALDQAINEGNYQAFLFYKKATFLKAHSKGSNEEIAAAFEQARQLAESQAVTFITEKTRQYF